LSTAKCRGTGRITCSKPHPGSAFDYAQAREQPENSQTLPEWLCHPAAFATSRVACLGTWKHSASPCNRKPFSSWLAGESRSMLLDCRRRDRAPAFHAEPRRPLRRRARVAPGRVVEPGEERAPATVPIGEGPTGSTPGSRVSAGRGRHIGGMVQPSRRGGLSWALSESRQYFHDSIIGEIGGLPIQRSFRRTRHGGAHGGVRSRSGSARGLRRASACSTCSLRLRSLRLRSGQAGRGRAGRAGGARQGEAGPPGPDVT